MTEPRLIGPIVGSLAAVVCFVIGRYLIPEHYAAARSLIILVGGLALLFALFGWADWFAYRFNVHMKAARMGWFGPQEYYRDLAREIRLMDRNQLRVFEHIGPLQVTGYLKGMTLYFALHTPTVDIPFTFIADYLDRCAAMYPDLVPQHGMPDSLRRNYVDALTRELVSSGLALPPKGNIPARWKVPFSEVVRLFGLDDGDEAEK